MSIQVQKYLRKFDADKYASQDNTIWISKQDIDYPNYASKCLRSRIDTTDIFIKTLTPNEVAFGIASSNLYNEIGLDTPYAFPVKIKEENELALGTQNIEKLNIKDLEIKQACTTLFCILKLDNNANYSVPTKWTILFNQEERNKLLEVMTEDCLEQLINLLLADELRADNDRHWGNFFFYKQKGSEKYEGLIVIDIDNTRLLRKQNTSPALSFQYFLHNPFISFTALQYTDKFQSHSKRIKNLKKLLEQGKLNNSNIETLTKAVNYDLAKDIQTLGEKHNISKETQYVYEMTSRLSEYNRRHLNELAK